MKDKHLVSIDLGTKKIALAVASPEDGRLKVLYYNEFPSDGISHSKILNTARLSKSLENAVGSAEKCLGIKIEQARVSCQKYDIRQSEASSNASLSSDQYITKDVLDGLEQDAWEDAQRSMDISEEILGSVAQVYNTEENYNISYENIQGMIGREVNAHYKIYSGRKTAKKNVETAFAERGIDFARMEFDPQTPGLVLLSQNERNNGVALVDMGAGATSVSIFYGGTLRHYAGIPFGGRSITMDIQNVCGISEKLAENIKLQFGGCLPNELGTLGEKTLRITDADSGKKTEITVKDLSEIITARVQEILEAVMWEIQQSGFADKLNCGIVITGGCSTMLNLCPFIKRLSGYSARVASPSANLFNATDKIFYSPTASAVATMLYKLSKEESLGDCTKEAAPESKKVEVAPITEIPFQAEEPLFEEEKPQQKEENSSESWLTSWFSRGKKSHQEKAEVEEEEKEVPVENQPYQNSGKAKSKNKKEEEGGIFELLFGDNNNPDDNA